MGAPIGLTRGGPAKLGGAAIVAALLLALASCALGTENLPASRAFVGRGPVHPVPVTLRSERGTMTAPPLPAIPIVSTPRPDSLKINRLLRDAIRTRPGASDTVLVTFQDPFASDTALIRHFTGRNDQRLPTSRMLKAISDSLVAARAPIYQRQADTLRAYGATVLRARYRLAQALLVVIPLGAIDSLARRPDVIHIDPLHGGGPPTGPCGRTNTTHLTAATLLRIPPAPAPWADLDGKLALLDTGVRPSHMLLRPGTVPTSSGPVTFNPLARFYEVCGDSCLKDTVTQEDVEPEGHGTSSAAILSATAAMGETQLGLTRARIDSYRVYDPPSGTGNARVNWGSAPLAFDHAVLDGNYLIVAEIADGAGAYGPLTGHCNYAYNLGAMVIAANGNEHQSANDLIPQPAIAPTALGVAEFCIASQAFSENNTTGQTQDGRGKPDLGGLGTIWTAGDKSDTAMHPYPGTSGATPTVGAAALVLRNWLKGSGDFVNPGQVYAALILCGQNTRVDPVQGAGLVQLPDRAELLWASATLQGGDSLEIQISKGSKWSQLDAAIWWPELDTSDQGGPASSRRAWIGLRLDDPERGASARSDVPGSVFQRASVHTSNVGRGTWFLTLLGNSIPEGQTRTVFWAVRGQE